MWVDALCISQKDDRERRQQVQMMSEIYSSARYVQAWLGLETEDTEVRWVIDEE
jgi:hypothetical protein